MVGDISEIFQQVSLAENDQKYHRFLWAVDGRQKVFKFQRLCFGMKASPYLACRAVRQVATDNTTDNSLSQPIIMEDTYIDDLICSVATVEKALEVREDIQRALDKEDSICRSG